MTPEEFVAAMREEKAKLLVDRAAGVPRRIEDAARVVHDAYRAMVDRFTALRCSRLSAEQAGADPTYQRCVAAHMVAQDDLGDVLHG